MLFLHFTNNKLLLLLLLLLNCIRCNKRIIPVQKAESHHREDWDTWFAFPGTLNERWLPEADLNSDLYDLKSVFFAFENNERGE